MTVPIWIDDVDNPKALLVVAHPDDETIFTGGLILTSQNVEWTIVCGFIQSEEGAREFDDVCKFLSEQSGNKILPVKLSHTPKSDKKLREELTNYKEGYDIVITHNYGGEYNGIKWSEDNHHTRINRCVIETIQNPNTWMFISPGATNVSENIQIFRHRNPRGNKILQLSQETLDLKKQALSYHKSQLNTNLYFNPNTGKFEKGRTLSPILIYNFEKPGQEEFTFLDQDKYKKYRDCDPAISF